MEFVSGRIPTDFVLMLNEAASGSPPLAAMTFLVSVLSLEMYTSHHSRYTSLSST